MTALKQAWAWFQGRTKAKPIEMPWAPRPDAFATEEHVWVLMQAHEQRDRRWKRASAAFVALGFGPSWAATAATAWNDTVGIAVGVGIIVPSSILYAYWRD